jgi:anti-anti-sigma factor
MSVVRGTTDGEQRPMAGWREGEPMYTDKQLVIRHTVPPNGLTFAGVLDMFNADAVAGSVATLLDGEDDLHLDLSNVEFCDVSGIRALVSVAESASGRRRLVMHGLPPALHRVMMLVGWGQLPRLALCDCGTEKT